MDSAWGTASGWQTGLRIGNVLESGAAQWAWRIAGTWQPSLWPQGAYHDPIPPLPLENPPYQNLAGVTQGSAVAPPTVLVLGQLAMTGHAQGVGVTSTIALACRPFVLHAGPGAVGIAVVSAAMLRKTPRMALVRTDDVMAPYRVVARTYDVGQVVELTATVTDRDNRPLDLPVRFLVKNPSGTETVYTTGDPDGPQRVAPGVYRIVIKVTQHGYWFYRCEAFSDESYGPGIGGAAEAVFEVRQSQFG